MLIKRQEMAEDPGLPKKLKEWAAQLNISAKKADAPTFKVSEPQSLRVRLRRHGMPMADWPFDGGEELRISSVVIEKRIEQDAVELLVILTPVLASLAADVAALSLPMAKALEVFESMEAWVKTSQLESDERAAARAKALPPVIALPTVEETRASESWGAW